MDDKMTNFKKHEELKNKTEAELARIQATNHPLEDSAILSRQEMQRRIIKEQHELNKEIVQSQKKIALRMAILSAVFGIIGVLVGAFLTEYLIEYRPIFREKKSLHTRTTNQEQKAHKDPIDTNNAK